jgi:hypothetical protein
MVSVYHIVYIAEKSEEHDVMAFSAEAQDPKGWELNVIAG